MKRAIWMAVLALGCQDRSGDDVPPDMSVAVDGGVEDVSVGSDAAVRADAQLPDVAVEPDAACPGGEALDACGVCGGDGPGIWYADVDGDGQGDERISVEGCEQPRGFVRDASDPEPECSTNDTDECGVCGGEGELPYFADADEDGMGDPAERLVACVAPVGYVNNDLDDQPDCATNDTDVCEVCGGPGERMFYGDEDGDALGDPTDVIVGCTAPDGYVINANDPEPGCASNDTDECGLCAGPGRTVAWADVDGDGMGDPDAAENICAPQEGYVDNADDPEPDCPTNDTNQCGVCGGEGAGIDCNGDCQGEAYVDGCGDCVGGETGREPAAEDDDDGDGVPNVCDECAIMDQRPRLIVQWTEVPPFVRGGEAQGDFTFQMILYANGDFRTQYWSVDGEPTGSPTLGYQYAGDDGVTVSRDVDFFRETPVVHFEWREDEGRYHVDYFQAPEFVDISEFGEQIGLGDDDQHEVDLGFEFPFGQATYGAVEIDSNGTIVLAGRNPGYNSGQMPVEELGAFIAGFWSDLNPAAGGTVHYLIGAPACDEDCNGDLGGFAYVDGCGVCVGGDTGVRESDNVDCNGDCDGEAFLDDCNRCVGGNTGIDPDEPVECLPDLIVDQAYLRATMALDQIVAEDECLIAERCVGGLGERRIIRFGTQIANIGTADLTLGQPRDGVDHWVFDECHRHYHYEAYARYDLYDVANEEMLPIGAKSGFAVIDIGVYDPELAPNGCRGYNGRNQGISVGCQDTYGRQLMCQWIDITGVPDGDYEVVVTTNPEGVMAEMNLENNSARVAVKLLDGELIFRDE